MSFAKKEPADKCSLCKENGGSRCLIAGPCPHEYAPRKNQEGQMEKIDECDCQLCESVKIKERDRIRGMVADMRVKDAEIAYHVGYNQAIYDVCNSLKR